MGRAGGERPEEARLVEERLAAHLRNLGRMYPVLAHDLHGLLNTMVLNLELLRRTVSREDLDAEAAERIRRYASLVAGEIGPLDRMLKAVVGQMRLSDPPSAKFDLRTLCEETAIVFDAYARHRRVRVHTTLADVPMAVAGDRDAVMHALTAILLGAVDALPAGALLRLALQADRREATLAVEAEPPEGGADGSRAEIPEPGPSAREILERHGARLEWNPEPREAARLEITLPLAPPGA